MTIPHWHEFTRPENNPVNPVDSTVGMDELATIRTALVLYASLAVSREDQEKSRELYTKVDRIARNGGSLAVIPF